MHDQPTTATDIDLLNMLAAGRRAGMPDVTSFHVDWRHVVDIHTGSADDAAQWEAYWARRDATDWYDKTASDDGNRYTHHSRIGAWRGAEIRIVHLVPNQEIQDRLDRLEGEGTA